ncbi:polysaccharide deacetylase family protein [Herbidospora sp. NEAU-GS84]|uniref:Polysaccharide deacetylase family protein n=1 Tax=Herbidospora solisilvae TaxID=2696284 RepID=A0A7C9JBZ7_9ACTN|nr:polysaccharide deacetylase family protein [Herbidospora solisilvae]
MIVRKVVSLTGVANVVVVTLGLIALSLMHGPAAPPRGGVPHTEALKKPEQSQEAPPQPVLPGFALPAPVKATEESARKAKANEVGLVPVLMYHRIRWDRSASIDRTPKQLRVELERLARAGYVPVTAAEFVEGRMDVAAGAHPVVLTFDDGNPSHFALGADGLPAKDTAVEIILAVAKKYSSFRPVATFYVNREPFGLKGTDAQKAGVRWLMDHGFEVANHTYAHKDLRSLSNKKVSEQIVRGERLLRQLGVEDFSTFALPFGSRPRKGSLGRGGSWDGDEYRYEGVFLAGAEPSKSPFAKGYDARQIQRIQSNGLAGDCRKWCSTYWLKWLDEHPGERYTADGDPETLSVPRQLRAKVASKRGKKVIYY